MARVILISLVTAFGLSPNSGAADEEPTLSEDQRAVITTAISWLKSTEFSPVTANWPYHFGEPNTDSPYLSGLMESPPAKFENGKWVIPPTKNVGRWLLTDLKTECFWLLRTFGYFGASHYYGPAKLNPLGELEPVPENLSNELCGTG
jgi:hypothetical protein